MNVLSSLLLVAATVALPLSSRDASDADIARLAPELGFTKGSNPTGFGDCLSGNFNDKGQQIAVPCSCPPDRPDYILALQNNVHAGEAVNNKGVKIEFPTDDSKDSALKRITAAAITLQNLDGPGKGCPIASTNLKLQTKEIEAGTNGSAPNTTTTIAAPSTTNAPSPASEPPTSSSTLTVTDTTTVTPSGTSPAPPTSAPPSDATATSGNDSAIAALVPAFGVESNVNPTGTGDCDGSIGPAGTAIHIPCQCPPPRDAFIKSLIGNVRAGQVLNNPSIKVTFPLDDSKDAKRARLNAAAVTLQNFAGEGKGCPIAATNWKKLGLAIEAGTDAAPSSSTTTTIASSSGTVTSPTPTSSTPVPTSTDAPTGDASTDADVARLAPLLGFAAGQNPSGTGDCDGAVKNTKGQAIKVPCACPPSPDVFIAALQANVRAGKAVNNPSVSISFPLGSSVEDQLTRINAAAVTIQNLDGAGKGCPMASTTLGAQAQQLRTGKAPTSPTPSSSSSNSTPPSTQSSSSDPSSTASSPIPSSTGAPDDALVARLAPELGHKSGVNPTGTGNCDGAVTGADGQVIQVPCTCPPAQDVYIAALQENVRAGKAVNNPTVSISYPTDDSKASQIQRITAALITLQNLNGVGKGCPASSTTLLKQQKALAAAQ